VTRPRRLTLACLAAGLLVRLGFGLVYWVHQPLTHDEREYLALARSLARGDGFVYPADEPSPGTAQQFGRAPGYPMFLALLHVTEPVDAVPTRVKVAQALVGTAGIWFIALIAGRAAGPRAMVVAAGLAAIYPPLVFIPAYALSETLYSTVALAAAYALEKGTTAFFDEQRGQPPFFAKQGDSRHYSQKKAVVPFVGGLLTGIAILIRPAMLFFVPLAILWLMCRRPRGRGLVQALIFGVLALACVAPWTIRNARVYHRFILVASEGGVTFWTGNHPLARGDGDLAANPTLKAADLEFRTRHAGLTPEELEPLYYRDAVSWIRDHPAAWMALLARKLFFTVVPAGSSYTLHSTKYLVASAGAYLLLLPAAVAGAWRLLREGQPPIALWLMAISTVIAGLVFFPQERFRIPVIDPALIVSAAALAAPRAHERTRRRSDL
jgi:hypothetical protein